MGRLSIRPAGAGDAAAIAAIYGAYVTGTNVSFETEPPSEAEMAARIAAGGDLYPWLVASGDPGKILGYASAGAFRARPAYRFTVETSVYLGADAVGRGIGRRLYARLIEILEAQGFAQAVGAITLPNQASVALHERLGFVRAGTYRDVGYKNGEWLSVGLWQRSLAPMSERPAPPKTVAQVWPETAQPTATSPRESPRTA